MADWHPAYTIIAGVPIALITSWVTVKLSLRRFQSEKWFERKVDAYTKVIDSLHQMKKLTARKLRAEESGIEIPENAEKELLEVYQASHAELRRLADMGSLIFSAEAIRALDELSRDLGASTPNEGWWLYYDAQSAAINSCLQKIREIGKHDLNA